MYVYIFYTYIKPHEIFFFHCCLCSLVTIWPNIDILYQIILCNGGCPVHCRIFNSFSDLYPLDANIPSCPPLGQPDMFPDIAQCPLKGKCPPIENHDLASCFPQSFGWQGGAHWWKEQISKSPARIYTIRMTLTWDLKPFSWLPHMACFFCAQQKLSDLDHLHLPETCGGSITVSMFQMRRLRLIEACLKSYPTDKGQRECALHLYVSVSESD